MVAPEAFDALVRVFVSAAFDDAGYLNVSRHFDVLSIEKAALITDSR
jgi:hypothetical protein